MEKHTIEIGLHIVYFPIRGHPPRYIHHQRIHHHKRPSRLAELRRFLFVPNMLRSQASGIRKILVLTQRPQLCRGQWILANISYFLNPT